MPDERDYDLTAARNYLRRLARAMIEAATSPDPRVVYLGIQLGRLQGKTEGR
jgi:hypothetical protein